MCWWNHLPNVQVYLFQEIPPKLIPGELDVTVVLRNLSGREVTLEPHTEVGIVTTSNIVP